MADTTGATTAPPPGLGAPAAFDLQTLFAFFLSGYGIHNLMLRAPFWWEVPPNLSSVSGGFTFVACLALMVRPRSHALLGAVAFGWSLFLWTRYPVIVNHEMATLVLMLTLGVSVVAGMVRGDEHWFARFAPRARWALLVLYFYVVWHKLNRDFFDPEISCAWTMYSTVANLVKLLPTGNWMRWPVVVGVILTEAGLPLAIAFKRTRPYGLIAGALFHGSLALHTNIFVGDFTLLMLLFYSLFVPQQALNRAGERALSLGPVRRLPIPPGAVLLAAYAGACALIVLAVGEGVELGRRSIGPQQFTNRLWFAGLCALWGLWLLAGFERLRPWTGESGLLRLRPGVDYLLPAVMVLAGFLPYLGLGTTPVFAMFSNIRFEQQNNHLFMPDGLRVFGYLDDVVTIVEASDPALFRAFEHGAERRPRVGWQQYLSRHAGEDSWVKVLQDDGSVTTLRRSDTPTPDLFLPPPTWLKLMQFHHASPLDRPVHCRH